MIIRYSLAFSFLVLGPMAIAQNVGIGTDSPQKKLSVNGSILVDQGNFNTGSVDSAALRFGTNSLVGISSNRAVAGINSNGLDFWTNGAKRMVITSTGLVGINNSSPQYLLDVYGTIRTGYQYSGGHYATGSIHSEYSISAGFDLTAGDDLSVTDDAYIGGNVGIGTSVDAGYKLKVLGNGLFTTNVGIDGTLRVDGKLTNQGKGIMLSNSTTTLRTGFSSGAFTLSLAPGQAYDITFCVTNFTGDNDNIRVMVSQFAPGTGASNWGGVVMTPHSVMASSGSCGGSSSCMVRFQNTSSSTANLGTGAILYLMSVVTH